MKSSRIKSARKSTSAGLYCQVVCSCKPCDGVKQYSYVFSVLNKSLGALYYHLGNSLVMLGKFVESRINNLNLLALYGFLDIRNFLGTLVDKKYQQMHLGIVLGNRLGNVLEKSCLTGLGRRYDHTSLSLTYRTHHIHYTHCYAASRCLKLKLFIRENRSQIFKILALASLRRCKTIYRLDKQKCPELVIGVLDPHIAHNDISGLETESPYLTGCNVNIIITGKIILAPDKSVSVAHYFKDTPRLFSRIKKLLLFREFGFLAHSRSSVIVGGFFRSLPVIRFCGSGSILSRISSIRRFRCSLPCIKCEHGLYEFTLFHKRNSLDIPRLGDVFKRRK